MTEETFTDYLLRMKRTKRYRSESKSDKKPSNSDTLFEIKHEKESKLMEQEEDKSEAHNSCMNILPKHKHCSKCKICHNFQRILKKDKIALSKYIQNNLQFLKLFGNQRYNQNSPSLFVEDYKRKLSEETMGLVPIPDKKVKANSINNNKKLYNLQRSIVMVRRFQYGTKSNIQEEVPPNIEHDIILIQRWWKRIAKIILIQKCFKGYFIRKQITSIINLHRFMQNFENFVHFLQIKYFFQKIWRSIVIPKKRKPFKGNYISKKKVLLSNKTINNIMLIQNNFRMLQVKKKYLQLLRENKFKVKNKNGYYTKKYYVTNGLNEKITMIQFNFRKYLKNKYYIERKIVHKNIGINFIDKNYIDFYSQKIISFYKLIEHGLKLIAIQKIRTKYKKFDKYNKDDINNIIFIQKRFLKYFYEKNPKKIIKNKKTKKVCFLDKIRLKENINKIKLIQKIYRKYNIRKTKLNNKLIRNKPISSSSKRKSSTAKNHNNINNDKVPKILNMNIKGINNKNKIKKKIDNLLEYKKSESNERLINTICYITKENKINYISKIILLQRKIFSYLFIKKLKNKNIPKFIIKKNYNLCFFITKINTNENHCINNIKKIQKMYKNQYKFMKSNIIEYNNTKNSNESENNLNKKHYNNSKDDNNENSKRNKIKNNNYLNEKNNDNNDKNKHYFPPKNYLIPNGNNNGNMNIKEVKKNYKFDNSNYTKNDKYYAKYKKNDNNNGNINMKKINHSLSQIKLKQNDLYKGKLTLRELIKKNKTPKKEIKGYYISKKRVEKSQYDNYLNFNKHIQHQIIKNPIYITKSRYYNNEQKIKKIQNFFKKIFTNNINIIRKPFTNVDEIKPKDNVTIIDKIKNKRKSNKSSIDNKNSTFNFTAKNLLIKKANNINPINSNIKKNYIKRYDTDEFDENKTNNNYNGGIIGNNFENNGKSKPNNYIEVTKYNINNGINKEIDKSPENKNYGNNKSNYNYVSKLRKSNILKYILLLQKNIRIFMNKNNIKYHKRINCGSLFISKVKININTYNKYIQFKNESNQIIKIPKKYSKNKTSGFDNKNNIQKNRNLLNKIKSNEIIVYEDDDNYNKIGNNNRINNDINFISKIRHINYDYYIKKIQKNWRIKKNKKLNIIIKPKIKKSIINIKRFKNNSKQILLIQKIYRNKLSKKKDEKNKIISRKSLFDSITKSKTSFKQYNKNKNNNGHKISINDINQINKTFQNNIKSQNNKNNKNKIYTNQIMPNKNFEYNIFNNKSINNKNNKIYKLSRNNSNKFSEENSTHDINGKKEFSFSDVNYISKIYKVIIFKKDINIKGIYFISKQSKKITKNKYDLSFVSLLNLFLTKNCQEYIYFLLKYNTQKSFQYPFYNKTLHRVLNFLRSNPSDTQQEGGEKIKKFFNKIFPELHSKKTNTILISSLSPESKSQLINANIYNSIETDFINYICSFSKYDKHLSNPAFIKTRLENTKLLNTNIFNITKFIDDEYNNLINGKYCLKCYLDLNKCICNKNKVEEETSFLEDDELDIDFGNDYLNRKNSEYNSIKCKGITINRKPKAEEVYEDPITCLISQNKDDYLDCNRQVNNFKNSSLNISSSQYWSNSTSRTNFNSKALNRIKNNVENENNSLNNMNNIAKIKAIYHQNNNSIKKENTILIRNNDTKNGS